MLPWVVVLLASRWWRDEHVLPAAGPVAPGRAVQRPSKTPVTPLATRAKQFVTGYKYRGDFQTHAQRPWKPAASVTAADQAIFLLQMNCIHKLCCALCLRANSQYSSNPLHQYYFNVFKLDVLGIVRRHCRSLMIFATTCRDGLYKGLYAYWFHTVLEFANILTT